jgi:hypothetical protein
LNAQNGEDQPEDETDEQHVEDGRNGEHERVDYDLRRKEPRDSAGDNSRSQRKEEETKKLNALSISRLRSKQRKSSAVQVQARKEEINNIYTSTAADTVVPAEMSGLAGPIGWGPFFLRGERDNREDQVSSSNRTFIPCQREMARKGRNARNVLSDLSADKLAVSSTATLMIDTCK